MSGKITERQRQLAKKSSGIAFLLSCTIPPIGYVYTKRWLALIISMLLELIFITPLVDEELFPAGIVLLISLGNICAFHNRWLIRRAKEAITEEQRAVEEEQQVAEEEQKQKFIESSHLSEDLELKLLQLLQQNAAGATIADFMLATHLKPAEIKTALQELEEHDAVRPTLRDQDGALIYQIVST